MMHSCEVRRTQTWAGTSIFISIRGQTPADTSIHTQTGADTSRRSQTHSDAIMHTQTPHLSQSHSHPLYPSLAQHWLWHYPHTGLPRLLVLKWLQTWLQNLLWKKRGK